MHIVYAGPFMGKMFLVILAKCKWMEVHKTASSSVAATISLVRTTFTTLGLPEVIISDNTAIFSVVSCVHYVIYVHMCSYVLSLYGF